MGRGDWILGWSGDKEGKQCIPLCLPKCTQTVKERREGFPPRPAGRVIMQAFSAGGDPGQSLMTGPSCPAPSAPIEPSPGQATMTLSPLSLASTPLRQRDQSCRPPPLCPRQEHSTLFRPKSPSSDKGTLHPMTKPEVTGKMPGA